MIFARFFVTSVLALVTVLNVGCTSEKSKRSALIAEGTAHLSQAATLETDLNTRYGVNLELGLGADFKWHRLSKAERQVIKEKLAEFVTHSVRVLELDTKKGLYVTSKEVIIAKIEQAMQIQKSLEAFENKFGENFDPKKKNLASATLSKTGDI